MAITKDEVARLRARVEADAKKKLEAIALVEQMLAEESEQANAGLNGSKPRIQNALESGTMIDTVAMKFRSNPDIRWTVAHLIDAMIADGFKFLANNPAGSLNTTLPKLVKRGVIRVVHKGRGKSPSVYQFERRTSEHSQQQDENNV